MGEWSAELGVFSAVTTSRECCALSRNNQYQQCPRLYLGTNGEDREHVSDVQLGGRALRVT